jgi:spore coat polysaccharide biosynthesis protein SpsF
MKKSNVLCLIQIHYSDFQFRIREFNPIKKLKNSGIFKDIILICPDVAENEFIKDFASESGVRIFFGDKNNVIKRMIDAADYYDGDVVVRPSIRWFMLDVELIRKQINLLLENKCDYVAVPYDFDERFGAEVYSLSCLKNINEKFNNNSELERTYKFTPSAYLEIEKHKFNVMLCILRILLFIMHLILRKLKIK